MPIAIEEVECSVAETQTPTTNEFLDDVIRGLRSQPKRLDSKYFYDQRGSQLFDQICDLPEYYVTRAELEIMQHHAAEMADCIGSHSALVEYGSGSSIKTDLLLDALPKSTAYLPVDISHDHLWQAARRLARRHSGIHIYPVTADFTQSLSLPEIEQEVRRTVVYFPGSTIGNFEPAAAEEILSNIADLVDADGGLLIGIDLRKDPAILKAAYNDAQKVTAEFNLNLLKRINAELGADFNLNAFQHKAIWNDSDSRIEMHLVSLREQTVAIDDQEIDFQAGESICTEYSHKYDVDRFAELAGDVGFQLRQCWKDSQQRFAVLYFEVKED